MKTRTSSVIFSALVAVLACDVETAPDAGANIPELLGLGDDWYPLSEGVWAHDEEDGTVRHLGIGEAGRRHTLAAMEDVGALLQDTYESDPSPENREALRTFQLELDRLQRRDVADIDELLVNFRSCIKSATGSAQVVAVQGGIKATASANFRNTCDSQTKSASSYAYTQANYQGKSHWCNPPAGLNVACSSTVTSYGSSDCYGWAEWSAAGLYGSKFGYTCGATQPPPYPYPPPPDCPPYTTCVPK